MLFRSYEIWFITRENGTGARIERPVIQFRLEGGRLTPPVNDAQPVFKPFRLIPVPQPLPAPPQAIPGGNGDGAAESLDSPDTDSSESQEMSLHSEPPVILDFADMTSEAPIEPSDNTDSPSIAAFATGTLLFSSLERWKNRFSQTGSSRFTRAARLARKRIVP